MMPAAGPAILSVLIVIGALLVTPVPAGEPAGHRVFFEDFSGELSRLWVPFSIPGPRITRSRGNPPPALDNGGDGRRRCGVISKRLFNLSGGVTVRADIFISSGGGDSVFGGSLGFPRDPEVFFRGQWPEWLVGMSYDYIGETEWSRGAIPEGGTLTCILVDEEGRWQISRFPYRNRWLAGWHNFEIRILGNGFVKFRIDGDEVYASRRRIFRCRSPLPLLLGHLSGRGGKVFHDNVEIRAGTGRGSGE